jgi:hypothetical protein
MCCSFDDLLSFCSTALGNESRGINIKQAKSKSKEDDFIKHGHGNYNKMYKYGVIIPDKNLPRLITAPLI